MQRRVPAERARHAKRLGHVQPGPAKIYANPILQTTTQQSLTSATSQTSQTSQTTVSSTQPSSSASAAVTHSSSTTSTSPTTSSAASIQAASTSTQSSTPAALSSTFVAQPTTLTSSTNPTPSSTPTTQVAAATSSGLSGGAIAGIIAGGVIVGVALIVFFVRKTYLRRRERDYISWDRAPGLRAGIPDEPKFPDISREVSFTKTLVTPQNNTPLSPFEPHGKPIYSTPVAPAVRMQPPTMSTHNLVPSPPPTAYNIPAPLAAYPTQPGSNYGPRNANTYAPGAAGMVSALPSARAQMEATVMCTFVPTLPDELSITTGERVLIVEQYDDGWTLCANGRGERGMVPRECLDFSPSDPPGLGWRNVTRMSSLNPDGTRY